MYPKYIFLSLALFFAISVDARAAAGDLDLSFNQIGTNRVGFGNGKGSGKVLVRQTDDKYVTVGTCPDGTNPTTLCLARFNPVGGLDLDFGVNGTVISPFSTYEWLPDEGLSLLLQTDGKIVVGGTIKHFDGQNDVYQLTLVRYQSNGSPDPDFGIGGKVVTTLQGYSRQFICGIAQQSDGKIVSTGYVSNGNNPLVLLARFRPNGTFDQSFGIGGVMYFSFGPEETRSIGSSVSVQPDGKIVVSGTYFATRSQFGVARILPDGALDTSFGSGGKALVSFNSNDVTAQAIRIQEGAKFVIGGTISVGNRAGFALARLNADGTLDPTFDGDGKLTTESFTYYGSKIAIDVQPNGIILATGTDETSSIAPKLVLARYLPDGRFDPLFNHGTLIRLANGQATVGASVAVGPDGKITVVGASHDLKATYRGGLAIFRFGEDGGLDFSFGIDGVAIAGSVGNEKTDTTDMRIQPDGKVVIAGSTGAYPYEKSTLTRFNADGTLDTAFGDGGKVVLNIGPGNNRFNAVRLLPGGKILAAGTTGGYLSVSGSLLVRFNADGSLDSTFNGDGILLSDITYTRVMSVQENGKILIGGTAIGSQPGDFDFCIVRFNSDGTLDNLFGQNGIQTISFGYRTEAPLAMALQNDGKIVVCGYAYTYNLTTYDGVVARLNSNGSIDNSFGNSGKVVIDINGGNEVQFAMAIQQDGKILTGGRSGPESGYHSTIFRYNTDGSFDQTFGIGGRTVSQIDYVDEVHSIALETNGKILVAGHAGAFPGADFTALRYNYDGSPDLNFGNNGIVKVGFTSPLNGGRAIAQDNSGRILVAGNAGGLLGVARLNGDNVAANFSISGRVLDSDGRAIDRIRVRLTDNAGVSHITTSSSFGYYSFENIQAGNITLSVQARTYTFLPQTIELANNISDFDLSAIPILQTSLSISKEIESTGKAGR